MSEEMVVQQCAPTLAGIKTGSIFSSEYHSKTELRDSIRALNHKLVPKGLRVLPLRCSEQRALIYVYRPDRLKRDLSDCTARRLLDHRGYCDHTPEQMLMELIRRLRSWAEFPHEIGLFLGYPPEDVQGFIENKAKNCKCVGCWKVYGDETAAKRQFEHFRKCTDTYCKNWKCGQCLEDLTVSAKQ